MSAFAISAHVTLEHVNELSVLRIKNAAASASIAIQGAHIFEYCAANASPVLFVSKDEPFKTGSPIRGGIPVCWPWFGSHPEESSAPAHGLVRNTEWQWEIVSDSAERTDICFWTETDGGTPFFPYATRVELLVSVGMTLKVALTTTNLDNARPIAISQALHTYFACDAVENVRLHGFDGMTTIDSLTGLRDTMTDDFCFDREIDWEVLDEGQPVHFSGLGHPDIYMSRSGSQSLVVWNPWVEKAQRLSSFQNDEYLKMFCVETTNTADDRREVLPQQSHTMTMELGCQLL